MKTTLLLALLLLTPQDEKDVSKAAKATLEKGSFTFVITPQTDLKDALPQDRAAVAGTTLSGEMIADGTYRTTDGTWEVMGRGKALITKTKDGWVPLKQVYEELVRDIGDGVGKDEGSRRNITQAKASYRKLLAIAHLYVRSVPPTQLIVKIDTDFKGLKKGPVETIDGRKCQTYEGDLKDLAAQLLLQGPYEEMVKNGSLVITGFSGRGKIWITSEGLIRRSVLEAAGKYTVTDKDQNTKKTLPATVRITADITKVGDTVLVTPREADSLLRSQEQEAEEK